MFCGKGFLYITVKKHPFLLPKGIRTTLLSAARFQVRQGPCRHVVGIVAAWGRYFTNEGTFQLNSAPFFGARYSGAQAHVCTCALG